MAISLRLSKEDEILFKEYAKSKGINLSELVRSAVLDKINSETDLKMFEQQLDKYFSNSKLYSLSDVKKELSK